MFENIFVHNVSIYVNFFSIKMSDQQITRARNILNEYTDNSNSRLRKLIQNKHLLEKKKVYLPEQTIRQLHEEYMQNWLQHHPKHNRGKFEKKLKEQAVLNGKISLDKFIEICDNLHRDRSINEAFAFYNHQLKLFSKRVSVRDDYKSNEVKITGFKNENKYKFYDHELQDAPSTVSNYFPSIKNSLKRYGLHKIAPRGRSV